MESLPPQELALLSLQGLAVGDALGERMFIHHMDIREIADDVDGPNGPYWYTDDTEMATALYEHFHEHNGVTEDALAQKFAQRYCQDPDRGYGAGARRVLSAIHAGISWREAAGNEFGGSGSMGNGAAMRVAPLGAFLSQRFDEVVDHASRSARVTHTHLEGIAGAVAIALSAAVAAKHHRGNADGCRKDMAKMLLQLMPASKTKEGIEKALQLSSTTSTAEAARQLGCGFNIVATDTVPFCVWNIQRSLDDYREALLGTIEVGGDTDTNAAIVGGVVACFTGLEGIPTSWREECEPLRFRNAP